MEELVALATLVEIPQWRGNRLAKLYEKTKSFSVILRAYNQGIDPGKIVAQYEARRVALVPFWDRNYPRLLKETEGRPLLLYVRGDPSVLRGEMTAVVGARENKLVGEKEVEEVVATLLEANKVVVSGLARGMDALAHSATLKLGGKTVAVLAHGLDRVYPRENEELAEKIVMEGGAVISEMPWGAQISRRYFLARNRIVVGMSRELIVMEAGVRSGSMASASLAAEMGREVWARKGSEGTDLLIEEGAGEI